MSVSFGECKPETGADVHQPGGCFSLAAAERSLPTNSNNSVRLLGI
jgi:hypothetical protein